MKMLSDKAAPAANNPLEPFVLLAKSAKGPAAVELIKQVLEVPGVYVFGELLDVPNVAELASGPYANYYELLNLFAYGTFSDYKANRASFPALTTVQLQKLRHLTIVSLATKSKCIPYATLLKELDLKNLRELEDLIIEVIYADIVHGKLDQKHSQLEVDYAIGRDIRPEDVKTIVSVLGEWCDSCEAILSNVESQIVKANITKDNRNKQKIALEQEVVNIKKTLKTQTQDLEEQMATDARDVGSQQEKSMKKQPKTKGLRGSGKFWPKST